MKICWIDSLNTCTHTHTHVRREAQALVRLIRFIRFEANRVQVFLYLYEYMSVRLRYTIIGKVRGNCRRWLTDGIAYIRKCAWSRARMLAPKIDLVQNCIKSFLSSPIHVLSWRFAKKKTFFRKPIISISAAWFHGFYNSSNLLSVQHCIWQLAKQSMLSFLWCNDLANSP